MSESKLFDIFVNSLNFNVNDYLIEEITELQKELIDEATSIIKDNIVGDMKTFGGSVKKNEEKFNELIKKAELELQKEKYKDIKKDLKEYLKKLSELIIKTCVAIIPVKEFPWIEVIFRTVPQIVFNDKIQFFDKVIAYYGEVKCYIGTTTIYGKMKGVEPLFAPVMGNLDLGGYNIDPNVQGPKTHIFPYIEAIIKSFDSIVTKNQLAKYHEASGRKGNPVCDFLMNDEDLMNVMNKNKTALDSDRTKSDIALCGIAVPMPSDKTSLILITNDSEENSRYEDSFESLLKFSAACCRLPSTNQLSAPTQEGVSDSGVVQTPGGQDLKVWTAEELAQQAQSRMASQPDIPSWSEEELSKFAQERGSGIPEGMEVWTENELEELAKRRQGGGLNIPEWKPDDNMTECLNCGYALRPGWSKCPICDTPLGEKPLEETKEEPEENNNTSDDKSEEVEEPKTEDLD